MTIRVNSYELRGREVIIRFTCKRCGKTYDEPAALQAERTEGNLQSWCVPEGWKDEELNSPMLCEECNKLLLEFYKGEKV